MPFSSASQVLSELMLCSCLSRRHRRATTSYYTQQQMCEGVHMDRVKKPMGQTSNHTRILHIAEQQAAVLGTQNQYLSFEIEYFLQTYLCRYASSAQTQANLFREHPKFEDVCRASTRTFRVYRWIKASILDTLSYWTRLALRSPRCLQFYSLAKSIAHDDR